MANGFCADPGVLQVFLILRRTIDIVKIAVPIGLIIMVMVDFAKGAMTGDKASKESISKAMKRIIAAVVIFFIPFIINLVIEILDESLKNEQDLGQYKVNMTDCWLSATQEHMDKYNQCLKDNKGNMAYCSCIAASGSYAACASLRGDDEEDTTGSEDESGEFEGGGGTTDGAGGGRDFGDSTS